VINIKIQRRLMNMSGGDSYVKPLSDEKALESGAEFIGEVLAYGTLFIWGIYEINKYSNDAKSKEAAQKEIIAKIHSRIEGIELDNKRIFDKIEQIKEERLNKKMVEVSTETDYEIDIN
jgi:Optic atrophy 3 protein (OPA3)